MLESIIFFMETIVLKVKETMPICCNLCPVESSVRQQSLATLRLSLLWGQGAGRYGIRPQHFQEITLNGFTPRR